MATWETQTCTHTIYSVGETYKEKYFEIKYLKKPFTLLQ